MGKSIRNLSAAYEVDLTDSGNRYPVVAITEKEVTELWNLATTKKFGSLFELFRKLSTKRGLIYKRNIGIITWRKSGVIFLRNFVLPREFRDSNYGF